jgi:hypothetical protein
MDIEQTISDIERLERILEMPDPRPLTSNDVLAANQKHDAKLANSPWFRLWGRKDLHRIGSHSQDHRGSKAPS